MDPNSSKFHKDPIRKVVDLARLAFKKQTIVGLKYIPVKTNNDKKFPTLRDLRDSDRTVNSEFVWISREEFWLTNAEISTFLDDKFQKLIVSHETSRSLTCVSSQVTNADLISSSVAEPTHKASAQANLPQHRH